MTEEWRDWKDLYEESQRQLAEARAKEHRIMPKVATDWQTRAEAAEAELEAARDSHHDAMSNLARDLNSKWLILHAELDACRKTLKVAEAELTRLRAALEEIEEMAPNWMQADAVRDWGIRMQERARAALEPQKEPANE